MIALGAYVALPSLAWADCPVFNNLPVGNEGALGYDTQTKQIYVCNGTSWVIPGN